MPNTGSLPNWIHGADPAAFFLPGFQAAAALAQARSRMQQEAQEFDVQSQMRQQALTEEAERRKQEMAIQAQQHAIATQLAVRKMQDQEEQYKKDAAFAAQKWQEGASTREAITRWHNAQAAKAAQAAPAPGDQGPPTFKDKEGNEWYWAGRGWSHIQRPPKAPTDTITERIPGEEGTPGTPAVPAKPKASILGIPIPFTGQAGAPAVPGVPAKPAMTITRHVPAGTSLADIAAAIQGEAAAPAASAATPAAAAAAPAPTFDKAPADPKERKADTTYATPKGLYTWTGEGWKPYAAPSHDEQEPAPAPEPDDEE